MDLPPKHVRFTHAALNYNKKEIRLLRVVPNLELSDPVHITIEHVDLGAHQLALAERDANEAIRSKLHTDGLGRGSCGELTSPLEPALYYIPNEDLLDFTALSYTWGAEVPTFDILVTSGNCQGWLSVRENLHDFLQLRRQGDSPAFWIDQICINQGHPKEKTHQVNQMSEIYSGATYVEVWLGPQFGGSHELLDLIALEGKLVLDQRLLPRLSWTKPKLMEMAKTLHRLAELPYWSRLWVIQEIILGRSVIVRLGDQIIDWETYFWGWNRLYSAWQRLFKNKSWEPIPQFITRLIYICDSRNRSRPDQPRVTLLGWDDIAHMIYNTDCSDVRDKAFGTMALVPTQLRFSADYSMELQEILLKLVTLQVEHGSQLVTGPNHQRLYFRHCVETARVWSNIFNDSNNKIKATSVRRHLLDLLLQDPSNLQPSFKRSYQLRTYLWIKIPDRYNWAGLLTYAATNSLLRIKIRTKKLYGPSKHPFHPKKIRFAPDDGEVASISSKANHIDL